MLKLTRKIEYGLIALRHLQQNKDIISSTKEIANLYLIPYEILAKTLQQMAKNKFIIAIKGPYGGYKVNRKLDDISLIDFFESMEGPMGLVDCNTDINCEQIQNCNIKIAINRINNNVRYLFNQISLSEITK